MKKIIGLAAIVMAISSCTGETNHQTDNTNYNALEIIQSQMDCSDSTNYVKDKNLLFPDYVVRDKIDQYKKLKINQFGF